MGIIILFRIAMLFLRPVSGLVSPKITFTGKILTIQNYEILYRETYAKRQHNLKQTACLSQ